MMRIDLRGQAPRQVAVPSASTESPPRVKVALVTNIPAPYRMPVFERLRQHADIDLCVFFCSAREPDRAWDLTGGGFPEVYLRERFLRYRQRFIHFNPDVWSRLREFAPDVVITTGFNPTFLAAYLFAKRRGARHVAMTDGTYFTESSLTRVHRLVRRWVYAGTHAFVGASRGSFELYRSYGVAADAIFQSHLCAPPPSAAAQAFSERSYDFVFSARFIETKNPRFALRVAQGVARRLGRPTRLLMLGAGPLDADLRREAEAVRTDVDVVFAGFVKQAELPRRYAQARVMLFPTLIDTWGVVANEAFAAGVPVVVTPMAGVADDLVIHERNGFVLPLEEERWIEAGMQLLQDPALHARFAQEAQSHVGQYTFDRAAEGIYRAVQLACRTR
jgi:glycosyltransferase involved in cell wall biosynthesis